MKLIAGVQPIWRITAIAIVFQVIACSGVARGQSLTASFASDFTLDEIENTGFESSQLAFGPDGRLYLSSFRGDLMSYAYNPSAANTASVLTDPRQVVSSNAVNADYPLGSLGVALHQSSTLGTVLYSNVAVPFSGGGGIDNRELGTIRRLNDLNGDGIFGDPSQGEFVQDIVTGLQVSQSHQVNNLLVRGDSLFFGIGTRTCSGGDGGCATDGFNAAEENAIGESSYTGALNYIADLNAIADTTTPNVAGAGITGLEVDNDSNGIADNLNSLTGAFANNGPGVFRVFSTGFRNVFGITADDAGNLLATNNQQENPTPQDALYETSQFADHGFDKFHVLLDNESSPPGLGGTVNVEGNFRTSPNTQSARDGGFFGPVISEPVAGLGQNSSANSLTTFASNLAREDLRNDAVVSYRAGGKVVVVDRDTGQVTDFVTGKSGNGLGVVRHPATGDLLISTADSILRVSANDPLVDNIFDIGDAIGVDFGSNSAVPNGDGAGQEPGFVLVGPADLGPGGTSAFDTDFDGVSVTVSNFGSSVGDTTAVAGDANQGFGQAGTGDYSGTPFSDLSFNDAFFANSNRTDGDATVLFTGLDDSLTYDLQAVPSVGAGPGSAEAASKVVTVFASGESDSDTVFDITGGSANGVLDPLSLTDLRTDGSGNLEITFQASNVNDPSDIEEFYLLAALQLTASGINTFIPGDVNNDGDVDLVDYGLIRDHFRNTGAVRGEGDLTGDGIVNFADFVQWEENFGLPLLASSQQVPEPTSLFLIVSSLIGLSARRQLK